METLPSEGEFSKDLESTNERNYDSQNSWVQTKLIASIEASNTSLLEGEYHPGWYPTMQKNFLKSAPTVLHTMFESSEVKKYFYIECKFNLEKAPCWGYLSS